MADERTTIGVTIKADQSPKTIAIGILALMSKWLNEHGDAPYKSTIAVDLDGTLTVDLTKLPEEFVAFNVTAGLPRHI